MIRFFKKINASKQNSKAFNPQFKKPNEYHNKSHSQITALATDPNTSHSHTNSQQQVQKHLCQKCNGSHALKVCTEFKSLSVPQRQQFVYKQKLCSNCLSHSHTKQNCSSKFTCFHCKRSHHTLLHNNTTNTPNSQNRSDNSRFEKPSSSHSLSHETTVDPPNESRRSTPNLSTTQNSCNSNNITNYHTTNEEKVVLPTALVNIRHAGEVFQARALIDQGSQRTFISERIQKRISLPTRTAHHSISGMGGKVINKSNKICSFTLGSITSDFKMDVNAIVLSKLTNLIPNSLLKLPNCETLSSLKLLISTNLDK